MMKSKLIGLLLLIILPMIALAAVVSAQTTRTGNTATVGKDEVINSTLWASGRTIDIAGTVDGDVFCAGQNISISGNVKGDVICAGQTVNISGSVEGDVRIAGQTVTLSSELGGNLTAAGQTVTLEGQSKVRDASIAGQDTALNGNVERDLSLATQTGTISGNVGRNVKGNVENLSITGNAQIGGSVEYTSKNDAYVASGAKIAGQTNRSEPTHKDKSSGYNFGFMFVTSIVMLVTALILVLIFPRAFHRASEHAVKSWGKTLLTGFVSFIVAPVFVLLLMFTIVGIPLGLLALAVWLLIFALSGAFGAYYLGRMVWRDQNNAVLIMLAGAVILLAVKFIPVIGWIISLFAIWFGIGMILLELKKTLPKPRYDIKDLK